jgi:glycosyltransferase involved in cell wall biosynthesis
MNNPRVSFVVPCYNLAHLLSECVKSILAQTYRDFEILIMDDCSPDNTAEIAKSFQDSRVKYIRNDHNLGHLRNYNKGIALSRGEYVWLISADDYLRNRYILECYVELMDKHPNIGYTFCPGIGVRGKEETELLQYSAYSNHDQIVKGHVFVKDLLKLNIVLAPSAMARRKCYERLSMFPLDTVWNGSRVDMGWCGDWYLWCLFALFFDVGYFAEPMVCYREHDLSMTHTLTQKDKVESCAAADIAVPWLIRQKAIEAGMETVARDCLRGIAHQYTRHVASRQYRSSTSCMTLDQFEESLCRSTDNEQAKDWIRARVFTGVGDSLFFRGDRPNARRFYQRGLRKDYRLVKVYAKLLLLLLGVFGDYVRKLVRLLRTMTRGVSPVFR